MRIDDKEAAEALKNMDNILILAHENPDGDAAGSAYALCRGLVSLGKKARVSLESLSVNDLFMRDGLDESAFEPEHIVSVDTADNKIMGVSGTGLTKDCKVELCIDHHMSNVFYADKTYLDEKAAAAAEVVYKTLVCLGVKITKIIAECLYVGLATDTGCFRYGNTTSDSLRLAAVLSDDGADMAKINKLQFETKTKEFASLERMAIGSMETYFGGKCAMLVITHDMFIKSGATDSETQALASLPRQIEGVLAGITMKERQSGIFRISVRTNEPADASAIASLLGGGGHKMAAGCSYSGSKKNAVNAVLKSVETVLSQEGLL